MKGRVRDTYGHVILSTVSLPDYGDMANTFRSGGLFAWSCDCSALADDSSDPTIIVGIFSIKKPHRHLVDFI